MKLKLMSLEMEHFKGINRLPVNFNGKDAIITAENGAGKTTVYDAWLYLLFGKDSTGRTDSGKGAFEVWPLDDSDEKIRNITVKVEGELLIDEEVHTFRREMEEKIVKGRLRGYTTSCWIDDVPKKISEYNEYIAEIIPEDNFKLLTDLYYFCDKMHWSDRRKILDAFGENATPPNGFPHLIGLLNGRTIDELKQVKAEEKKKYEEERDGIPPRIDELVRGLTGIVPGDTTALNSRRDKIKQTIADLDAERDGLFADEKKRQKTQNDINHLEVQKRKREVDLQSDTSAVQALCDERARIKSDIADKKEAYNTMACLNGELEAKLNEAGIKRDRELDKVQEYRDEIQKIEQQKDNDTCYNCGRKLPNEYLQKAEEKKKAKIDELQKSANKHKETAETLEKVYQEILVKRNEHAAKMKEEYGKLEFERKAIDERLKAIAEAIKNRPKPNYNKDAVWQELKAKIEALKAELGEPVSDQLTQIEDRRKQADAELQEVNKALAQSDRAKKDKERIAELESREKELSQKIADCEKILQDIRQFKAAESKIIEEAVNGHFKHVTFKLFRTQLNGDIDNNRCDAIYNGRPYNDISTGEKILVGVDIVNTLSEYYGLSVPLFIDHAESLTLPIEANSQTIQLYAKPGVKSLHVEVQKDKVEKAA